MAIVGVTGGTGFIGRRLVKALVASGHSVRVMTRNPGYPTEKKLPVQFALGDLATGEGVDAFTKGLEVLFHCAGELNSPLKMHALHVDGTRRLITAASGHVQTWVQLSSTGAYGSRRHGIVTERDLPRPVGIYEKTKLESDVLVETAGREGRFAHVILRPSIVFGSDMPNQSLFALMRVISKGAFFFIGRPGASANYVHVDNVVDALVACGFTQQAAGQIFNLSDHATIEQFVAMLADAIHAPRPRTRLPEAPIRLIAHLMGWMPLWPLKLSRVDALTTTVVYPTTLIESELGYRHKVSMAEGVLELTRAMNRAPL